MHTHKLSYQQNVKRKGIKQKSKKIANIAKKNNKGKNKKLKKPTKI